MRRAPAWLFLSVVLAAAGSACAERGEGVRADPAPACPVPGPAAAKAPLPPFEVVRPDPAPRGLAFDAGARDAPILVGLRSAVVQTGARAVGSTSVVLKLPLDGGLYAAFKPQSRKHGGRWRAEVAAYRLSRALGLDNVPPATPRAVKLASLFASTKSAVTARLLKKQLVPDDDGAVRGAMIAWLPGLQRLPLENDPFWTAWGEWLAIDPPQKSIELRVPKPVAKRVHDARPLAPQVSTLVAFDHLTGNRDRWSGHNVLTDVTGARLVFLDHNLAFDAALDLAATKRRTHVLHRVERFSRAFVAKVRALHRDELVRILGDDDRGAPLLEDAQLDAVLARRDELVAWIDALVAAHGEPQVLCFE